MARKGKGKTFFAFVNPAGPFHYDVRLCQQKLHKTTFDRALGTGCRGASFWLAQGCPGGRPGSPEKAEEKGPKEPCSRGKMATGAQARGRGSGRTARRASQAGRQPFAPSPRAHSAPPPAAGLRAGAGRGLPAGKPGARAEGGAERCLLGARLARALLHNLAPRRPGRSSTEARGGSSFLIPGVQGTGNF